MLQANAQSDMDERTIRFGLMAAPNFGWIQPGLKEITKDGLQSKIGFGYGLMCDYKFSSSPNYLLATGINITTNGGGMVEPWDTTVIVPGIDTSSYLGRVKRTHRFQYVNVPILLKMRTNEIGYMTYFGSIGFDLGFRTRARVDNKYTWQGNVGPADEKDLDNVRNIRFLRIGLNITLGAEYNLSGNTNAYLGIGWHNSFTNMYRSIPQNRIIQPDDEGFPKLDANGNPIYGPVKKAVTNYISLDVGVFF
ncbi:MAG: hypothetical protein Kow0075_11940 [Salibacteraceae bacterium]